ncbi:MAG: hypothetical protein ACOCQD_00020 [archaeon]
MPKKIEKSKKQKKYESLQEEGINLYYYAKKCWTGTIEDITNYTEKLEEALNNDMLNRNQQKYLYDFTKDAINIFGENCECMNKKQANIIKSMGTSSKESPSAMKLENQMQLIKRKANECSDNYESLYKYMNNRIDSFYSLGRISKKEHDSLKNDLRHIQVTYDENCL